MATVISKEEAGVHFADLFERAIGGEEIVIEQVGRPKLKLVVVDEPKLEGKRSFGLGQGQFTIPDSFFDPMSEEELREWGF